MTTTLAYIEEMVAHLDLTPVQIDGIPEGFSFQTPVLTISGKPHGGGDYVAYIPLSNPLRSVMSPNIVNLQKLYKLETCQKK